MRVASWLAVPLLLSACVATWKSVVRYSDTPVPAVADAEEGVYEATLVYLLGKGPDSAVVRSFWGFANAQRDAGWADSQMMSSWPDTLKRELRVALTAPTLWIRADSVRLAEAAASRGTAILWHRDDAPLHPLKSNFGGAIPLITLSRPGFNADSTLAAIQVSALCGPLCGSSQTLFLARRPGIAWHVWGGHLGLQS